MTTRACSTSIGASLKRPARLAAGIIALLLFAVASPVMGDPGQDHRAPEVPATLAVGAGNKVSFHAFAVGVQIYRAMASPSGPTPFIWSPPTPEAVLFDDDGNIVGVHYAGPTWETESGSKVVGARVDGVTVDTTAIPWLLLRAASTEGPGVLERTTYVQRVNTTGGLPPATPPTQLGEEKRVPYTADYFFFRQSRH